MKSFGKGLFWLGFILLMGVVIAYLIIMVAGAAALAVWSTALAFCVLIFFGGVFMLIGRTYERKGEKKHQMKEMESIEKSTSSPAPSPSPSTGENA